MKNSARLLTPAAVNKALDKINANPARKTRAVRVVAANPTKSKSRILSPVTPLPNDSEPLHALFSYYVQWFNTLSSQWRSIAAFANEDDATAYAKAYSKSSRGASKTIRVATPDR